MNLVTRDVEASCRKLLDKYKDNCSGFVRAVSDDLMLYLPGASGNATEQVDFMKLLLGSHARTIDSLKYLGDGKSAEPDAVRLAEEGNFVVCGMTQKELQRNRAGKTVANGHVAVVVGGWSRTGWPLAYWGQKGGTPGRRESLSKSFRSTDRESIHYFAVMIPAD